MELLGLNRDGKFDVVYPVGDEGECLPTDHPSDLPPPMLLPRENSPPSVPRKSAVGYINPEFSTEVMPVATTLVVFTQDKWIRETTCRNKGSGRRID
ncbi:hypothetical protein CEXT_336191 [Caerostris extrusa]|uniref:Uncharacterized protein n=1 Tax=Caerostris extrusa TaxID=172846 RepID=A0AAV4Q2Q4_CAEEX|nr:hypothetical protein CEXT_336191 [Caerostris extrusa]